jgi:hypothetical protein
LTEPAARSDLSLACNGCTFRCLHSRVSVPGLLLRSPDRLFSLPVRLLAPPPRPGLPRNPAGLNASNPLQPPQPAPTTAPATSTPLWDFSIPQAQSVLPLSPLFGPPSGYARSPLAPRSPNLLLEYRLRIIVPGPLRFRRLAVPQTSWNLHQYDSSSNFGQYDCD